MTASVASSVRPSSAGTVFAPASVFAAVPPTVAPAPSAPLSLRVEDYASAVAAGAAGVDGVWRRGRQLVVQGRHVHREPIAARYRRTLAGLLA